MNCSRFALCFYSFVLIFILTNSNHFINYAERAKHSITLLNYSSTDRLNKIKSSDSIQNKDNTYYIKPNSTGEWVLELQKEKGYIFDLWANFPLANFKGATAKLYIDTLSTPLVLLENQDFTWGNLLHSFMSNTQFRKALIEAQKIKLEILVENQTHYTKPIVHWLKVHSHSDFDHSFYIFPLFLQTIFVWLVISMVSVKLLQRCGINERTVYSIFIPCLMMALLMLNYFNTGHERYLITLEYSGLFVLLLAGAIFYLHRAREVTYTSAAILLSLLFSVLFSVKAWQFVSLNANHYLEGSMDSWTDLARSMELFTEDHGFFSANFAEREPFYIFITHLWFKIFGDSNFSHLNLNLFTLLAYIFIGSYFIFRVSRNLYVGFILCSFFYWQIGFQEPIQWFLREPLFYLLLVLLTFVITVLPYNRNNFLITTIIACLLILTRSTILVSIVLMLMIAMLLKRITISSWTPSFKCNCSLFQFSWQKSLVLIFSMVLIWQPISYNIKKRHGSSNYWIGKYARWNANSEFVEKLGQPGFPSKEEWQKDAYAGPPITYFDYLFKMRTFSELISKNWEGLVSIVRHQFQELGNSVLARVFGPSTTQVLLSVIIILGLILELVKQRELMLSFLWAWYFCQNIYTFHLYPNLLGDRHVDHSYFTLILILAVSFNVCLFSLKSYWKLFYVNKNSFHN